MLLFSFGKPELSLRQLDDIIGHIPGMFTWMSDALLWLDEEGFEVENYESLDYTRFVKKGIGYLREIWDKETFAIQESYSDLERERKIARKMLDRGIKLVNVRLSLSEIKDKHERGYFTMLSVNPFALRGKEGYGSHLIVVKSFGDGYATVLDPDAEKSYQVSESRLEYAISKERKMDFNAICVRLKTTD
jgi:hypothetical protein